MTSALTDLPAVTALLSVSNIISNLLTVELKIVTSTYEITHLPDFSSCLRWELNVRLGMVRVSFVYSPFKIDRIVFIVEDLYT